ncbi:MAG: hypothetical protein ACLU9S_23255 [Oscillospiraceae bacterium]
MYLYCMTNPHTNLCGCYEVSIKQMANETGLQQRIPWSTCCGGWTARTMCIRYDARRPRSC